MLCRSIDYRIDLINGYNVVRLSSNNIKIFKKDSKDSSCKAPSIPIYLENKFISESVLSVGYDIRYILDKTNKNIYYTQNKKLF